MARLCLIAARILTAFTGLWTLYWLLHTASPSLYIYGLIDNCWPELNSDTKSVISIENKLEFDFGVNARGQERVRSTSWCRAMGVSVPLSQRLQPIHRWSGNIRGLKVS